MAGVLTATEVARNFADYLNRVLYRRESFVVMRGKKPVAELRPLPAGKRLSDLPALIAALPPLSDEDAADFERDVESSRESLSRVEVRDAWES